MLTSPSVPTYLHLCYLYLTCQEHASCSSHLKFLKMRKRLFLGQKVFRSEGRNVRKMLLGLLEGLTGTKEDQGHEKGFCSLLLSLHLGVSRKTSWNLNILVLQKSKMPTVYASRHSFPATQIPAL